MHEHRSRRVADDPGGRAADDVREREVVEQPAPTYANRGKVPRDCQSVNAPGVRDPGWLPIQRQGPRAKISLSVTVQDVRGIGTERCPLVVHQAGPALDRGDFEEPAGPIVAGEEAAVVTQPERGAWELVDEHGQRT